MRSNNKVSIITLGCPKNLVDSETLLNSLHREGFSYTEDPEEAGIILINTCGFIEDAKKESIEEILLRKDMLNGDVKLVVFGCLAERYRDELLREIPEIDALFGVGDYEGIIEYCKSEALLSLRPSELLPSGTSGLGYPLYSSSYAYVKIADGCNRACSFCVIPSIRGRYRSFDPEDILRKAEEYISLGIKELIIVAQDICSYGKELNGYDLSSLLMDMASISGDFWIRLLYLYPTSINDRLIRTISEEEKICKYLDIPFQHSEDRILRAMGRKGNRDGYRELIRRIREAIPGVTLRTTMIVGFPGETEEDFMGLRDFVEEMEFDRLGVFTYSREEGTRASRLKDHIPKRIKDKRKEDIMNLQSIISLRKNLKTVGHTYRALIDEIDGELVIARLYSQAPEIDGVVIIQNPEEIQKTDKKNLCSKPSVKAGEFITVKIVDAFDYDLKGEVIR